MFIVNGIDPVVVKFPYPLSLPELLVYVSISNVSIHSSTASVAAFEQYERSIQFPHPIVPNVCVDVGELTSIPQTDSK